MEEYLINLPVCRVCLQASAECIEIYAYVDMEIESDQYDPQTYLDCLESCTNLNVKIQDGQPKHICSLCETELLATVAFIKKAKDSHYFLLENESQMKTDTEKEDHKIFEKVDFETIEKEPEIIEVDEESQLIPLVNDTESLDENEEPQIGVFETLNFPSEIKHDEVIEISNQTRENIKKDEEGRPSDEEVSMYEFDGEYNELFEILHRCNLCPLTFEHLDDLKHHGEESHGNSMFCCIICYHRFNSKFALSDHLKSNHSDENHVICGDSVESASLRNHKKAHRKSTFLCTACPRTFKTLTGLQIHTETHNENRQRNFECEFCQKKYLTERTYKVHLITHKNRERFKCDLCDKKFLQKINLKLHMQMHRGETMDCMYCEKKFVRKMDLTIHMRFHTGNFPYECPHCDKRFAIVSHLNYHAKRHQGYMYKCEVCDKEFINKSGLRNHSFQHTMMPFNCTLCDKGFPTRFKIKRHLKTVHHVEDNDDLDQYITKKSVKIEQLEQPQEEGNEDDMMKLFIEDGQSV